MTERYRITIDYGGGEPSDVIKGAWIVRSIFVRATRVRGIHPKYGPSLESYSYPFDEHSSPHDLVSKLRSMAEKTHDKNEAERFRGIADQIETGDLGDDLAGLEEQE